jgi:hypothetical protein
MTEECASIKKSEALRIKGFLKIQKLASKRAESGSSSFITL